MSVILQNIWVKNSQETECVEAFAVWRYTGWYVWIFTITERIEYHWL